MCFTSFLTYLIPVNNSNPTINPNYNCVETKDESKKDEKHKLISTLF